MALSGIMKYTVEPVILKIHGALTLNDRSPVNNACSWNILYTLSTAVWRVLLILHTHMHCDAHTYMHGRQT